MTDPNVATCGCRPPADAKIVYDVFVNRFNRPSRDPRFATEPFVDRKVGRMWTAHGQVHGVWQWESGVPDWFKA